VDKYFTLAAPQIITAIKPLKVVKIVEIVTKIIRE
jgi:hypothetical protein